MGSHVVCCVVLHPLDSSRFQMKTTGLFVFRSIDTRWSLKLPSIHVDCRLMYGSCEGRRR